MPSLAALQKRLVRSYAELTKVVQTRPTFLGYSIEKDALPSVATLQKRLELSDAKLKKVA